MRSRLRLGGVLAGVGFRAALADRRATRVQQRSDDELAPNRRLLGDLFTLATTAAPARELRTYGIATALGTRHHQLGEEIRRRSVHAALRSAAWEALGWVLFAVGFVGAVVVLVLRAAHGHVSPGQVVMSISLLRRSQVTLSSAADTAGTLGTSARTARQLMWLEDYVGDRAVDLGDPGEDTASESEPSDLAASDGARRAIKDARSKPGRRAPSRLQRGITFEGVLYLSERGRAGSL